MIRRIARRTRRIRRRDFTGGNGGKGEAKGKAEMLKRRKAEMGIPAEHAEYADGILQEETEREERRGELDAA